MVVGATKLTADSWSSVVDDVYNRPTKKRPYYYVHNQNDVYVDSDGLLEERNSDLPTLLATDKLHSYEWSIYPQTPPEPETDTNEPVTYTEEGDETDGTGETAGTTDTNTSKWGERTGVSNFDRTFNYVDTQVGDDNTYVSAAQDAIEKPAGSRHANSSRVKVEIRCGRDKSNIFSLSAVQIDYVKAPQFIRLTQEQLDSDEDISQVMEFPDYVNQEIVNELVNLVMRKTNDPSLTAHM